MGASETDPYVTATTHPSKDLRRVMKKAGQREAACGNDLGTVRIEKLKVKS